MTCKTPSVSEAVGNGIVDDIDNLLSIFIFVDLFLMSRKKWMSKVNKMLTK